MSEPQQTPVAGFFTKQEFVPENGENILRLRWNVRGTMLDLEPIKFLGILCAQWLAIG